MPGRFDAGPGHSSLVHTMKYILLYLTLIFSGFCHADDTSAPVTLRILSYNIYHGVNTSGTSSLALQAEAIRQTKADFVGLQEVDNGCKRSGNVNQPAELGRMTGMHHAFAPHFEFQGGTYGIALLSRYPLSNICDHRIPLINKDGTTETRALLSAEATLENGTTVTIATVHLGLTEETRHLQIAKILETFQDYSTPVILTGDFNAEPGTPELLRLEKKFTNLVPPGALTFPSGNPTKTIDYIMVRSRAPFQPLDFQVLGEVLHSDHLPIWAELKL